MAKPHSQFVCQQCGYSQVGWSGKCPNCGTWGSLVETLMTPEPAVKSKIVGRPNIRKLSQVKLDKNSRTLTKIPELDRVLGGGIVKGQVILLAGEPGIGKSTILLELANNMGNVLYTSGEESGEQIGIRAARLGIKNEKIRILESTDIDSVIENAKSISEDVTLLIVDSIQTMTTSDLSGLAGSVGQIRECASRLVQFAKINGVPVILVGHVTKEGAVAGPAVLAHIVDTVLWFEGDKETNLRLLHSYKNRFGATDEVGIFEMGEKGLISLTDPSQFFLEEVKIVPGSVTTSILEGSRPILAQIEALVVPTKLPFPKRLAQGFDVRRLELLIAILIKRAGIPLWDLDVFVNVTGGLTIKDPAADLAVCLAIASSYKDVALKPKSLILGEVGLLGEIRNVKSQDKKVKEGRRMGYTVTYPTKEVKYLSQVVHNLLTNIKSSKDRHF